MTDRIEGLIGQEDSCTAGQELRLILRGAVRQALRELVQEEVTALCGRRYHPLEQSDYFRAGSAPSNVYVQGVKESMSRPRVRRRTPEGPQEVILQSWKAAQDPAEWEEATMRAVLCGVSSRDAACLRAEEVQGQSKTTVSRLWQKKAGALVEEVQQSDLSDLDLLVLMIDAVVLAKDLVATVALGIDTQGCKKVLGFRVGGSENKEVCMDLLSNLQRRGLKKARGRRLLAVLDGSDALRGAVLAHYPDTLVQRCLVHKERNVKGYLGKRHWGELAALFKNLRQAQGKKDAEEAADAVRDFLKDKNAQARESFEEAGEDLLRLFELEVPNTLHRSLLSTNCIENVFKNLRRHIGRVCRWHKETGQADRWMASGLKLAEIGFRRIAGHSDLPALKQALEKSEANQQAA